MANLTIFATFFATLLALSTASTYTTTTVVTEVINPERSCQTEIQRMRMTHCMQYMQAGMGATAYEPSFIRSAVANPKRYEEEHLEECCDELRSVSSDCRGDAVRHLVKEWKEKYGTEEMETPKKLNEKVRALPRKCSMKSSPWM